MKTSEDKKYIAAIGATVLTMGGLAFVMLNVFNWSAMVVVLIVGLATCYLAVGFVLSILMGWAYGGLKESLKILYFWPAYLIF